MIKLVNGGKRAEKGGWRGGRELAMGRRGGGMRSNGLCEAGRLGRTVRKARVRGRREGTQESERE